MKFPCFTCCQFHQYFMRTFFIRQLFSSYVLALAKVRKHFCMKNAHVKCWWNWQTAVKGFIIVSDWSNSVISMIILRDVFGEMLLLLLLLLLLLPFYTLQLQDKTIEIKSISLTLSLSLSVSISLSLSLYTPHSLSVYFSFFYIGLLSLSLSLIPSSSLCIPSLSLSHSFSLFFCLLYFSLWLSKNCVYCVFSLSTKSFLYFSSFASF